MRGSGRVTKQQLRLSHMCSTAGAACRGLNVRPWSKSWISKSMAEASRNRVHTASQQPQHPAHPVVGGNGLSHSVRPHEQGVPGGSVAGRGLERLLLLLLRSRHSTPQRSTAQLSAPVAKPSRCAQLASARTAALLLPFPPRTPSTPPLFLPLPLYGLKAPALAPPLTLDFCF